MKIIDLPKLHLLESYTRSINQQVDYLSKLDEVKSIYQIGGISTLGISDIDLIVVFKDKFNFTDNPMEVNDDTANYLFTHNLFGVSNSLFKQSLKYTFFHNYKLLYGFGFNLENPLSLQDQKSLKRQIALEYLIKMYINLAVQKEYKTIKLRSIFLHIKALPYDFEYLSIEPIKLIDLVNEGLHYRNNWFSSSIPNNTIEAWFTIFFDEYYKIIDEIINENKLFLNQKKIETAKNIIIQSNNNLSYLRKGFSIQFKLPISDKKLFNLNNRLNTFMFNIPYSTNSPSIIRSYFNYCQKTSEYNKKHLPFFMPMTSSLNKN